MFNNIIIKLLLIINLSLTATYLIYKVPDIIANGFEHVEHTEYIYVNSPRDNAEIIGDEP